MTPKQYMETFEALLRGQGFTVERHLNTGLWKDYATGKEWVQVSVQWIVEGNGADAFLFATSLETRPPLWALLRDFEEASRISLST